MRTLPDSPSLDHLRQQAKDLLQHLRAVRSGATLSDAQTAVAEQYGYRTWPELKTEVERRSASVRTADGQLAAAVADAFGLGAAQGPLVAHERQWAGQGLGAQHRSWPLARPAAVRLVRRERRGGRGAAGGDRPGRRHPDASAGAHGRRRGDRTALRVAVAGLRVRQDAA